MIAILGESTRYGMEINRAPGLWTVDVFEITPTHVPRPIAHITGGGYWRLMLRALRALAKEAT